MLIFQKKKKIQTNLGDVLNKELKIYATPTEFFTTKFRQIFKNTQIKFTTSKYGRKWLGGPHMSFWPQQLKEQRELDLPPSGSVKPVKPKVCG